MILILKNPILLSKSQSKFAVRFCWAILEAASHFCVALTYIEVTSLQHKGSLGHVCRFDVGFSISPLWQVILCLPGKSLETCQGKGLTQQVCRHQGQDFLFRVNRNLMKSSSQGKRLMVTKLETDTGEWVSKGPLCFHWCF